MNSPAIHEEDIPFARIDEDPLLMRVYRSLEPAPASGHGIVSVHGGAWCKNDRTSAHVLDRGLARFGLTVFALDFRQGPTYKYPAASQDIRAGIRFARANAERFGIDEASLGLVGSSSGGQLALLAALSPSDVDHEGTRIAGNNGQSLAAGAISAELAYVLSLWPVSDPLYRFRYANEVGRDDLVEGHHAYFRSEQEMEHASIARRLLANSTTAAPPVWLVQPGADTNVPQEMTIALVQAMQAREVPLEYVFYPGLPHALTRDDTADAARCIADATHFIARQLSLSGNR